MAETMEIQFTLDDRDLMIRIEQKYESMKTEMTARFEAINDSFDQSFRFLLAIIGIFTTMMVDVSAFASFKLRTSYFHSYLVLRTSYFLILFLPIKSSKLYSPRSHREKAHIEETIDLPGYDVDLLEINIGIISPVLKIQKEFHGIIRAVSFDPETEG
jgi:hypothetical protein